MLISGRVPPPDQMVTSSGIRRPVSPGERLLREALALFLRPVGVGLGTRRRLPILPRTGYRKMRDTNNE